MKIPAVFVFFLVAFPCGQLSAENFGVKKWPKLFNDIEWGMSHEEANKKMVARGHKLIRRAKATGVMARLSTSRAVYKGKVLGKPVEISLMYGLGKQLTSTTIEFDERSLGYSMTLDDKGNAKPLRPSKVTALPMALKISKVFLDKYGKPSSEEFTQLPLFAAPPFSAPSGPANLLSKEQAVKIGAKENIHYWVKYQTDETPLQYLQIRCFTQGYLELSANGPGFYEDVATARK